MDTMPSSNMSVYLGQLCQNRLALEDDVYAAPSPVPGVNRRVVMCVFELLVPTSILKEMGTVRLVTPEQL